MNSIYVLRWYLYTKIAAAGAQIVASVLNVAQIQLMTLFFNWVAFKMTDAENRRTDDEYQVRERPRGRGVGGEIGRAHV